MPQSTDKPLLQVRDLKIEFPTRRGILTAVDGISTHIREGEFVCPARCWAWLANPVPASR